HGSHSGAVPDHVSDCDLPAGLAAGMDRDHRDLHAHLPAPGEPLRHRPAVLRLARGAEPANRLLVAACRHVRLLSEGCFATTRDAQPDLPGNDALHGYPDSGHRADVYVPRYRYVVA